MNHTKTPAQPLYHFVRENEIQKIYRCELCGDYFARPRSYEFDLTDSDEHTCDGTRERRSLLESVQEGNKEEIESWEELAARGGRMRIM